MKHKKFVRCFGRSFNFKIVWSVGVLMLAAALFGASAIYAAQDGSVADNSSSVQDVNVQHKNFSIQKKDSLITLQAKDADLSEVLKEIENVSGVKMTIDQKLIGKKMTAKVADKDVEGALREVLRGQYYILTYEQDQVNKEKKVLKEAKVKGDVLGSKPLKGEMTSIEIPYGSGKGEVGANLAPPVGPRSFAVDAKGDIYICDTINKRIQVFSSKGIYLSTIPLKEEIFAEDIAIDKRGYIYINSGAMLYQLDRKGNIITSINVTGLMGSIGPVQIIEDKLYEYASDSKTSGEVIIGRISSNDLLVGPSADDPKGIIEHGKGAPSGELYITGIKDSASRTIEIMGRDRTTSKFISFPSYESGSWIAFLGEDGQGHSYFSANGRNEKGEAVPEVHKLDTSGNYLSSVLMSPVRGSYWAIKDYEIDRDGTIYDFRAEEDKLRLYIYRFSPEGN